ncbi:protein MODIFYING WALL LIGNIN-1 isoform X2 [Magnolia sinica]|uniref:protein MODIFYING WALL LIGNIN-1 isoform X2 n=1 Tax=Magnolia sinica TaxID=86752 RepID=UPI0026597CD1|nr:protein MODIFYING WALL LIGNIN-1 isoform X2 [Magnolia sinica]
MEKKVLLICFSVGFLAVVTAALGFAAEAKRVKVSDVKLSPLGTCTYPRSPALPLGVTAGVALMVAQVIINTAARCVCCKRNPHPSTANWSIALICFVVSWVTFIIAFLLLLTGAALNDQHGEEKMYFGNYCFVVKAGVFAGGAVLSLASISLGIIYYITLSSAKSIEPWGPQNNQGIAMGTPHIPPQNLQTVFVPEDTYNRRQFT